MLIRCPKSFFYITGITVSFGLLLIIFELLLLVVIKTYFSSGHFVNLNTTREKQLNFFHFLSQYLSIGDKKRQNEKTQENTPDSLLYHTDSSLWKW